MNTQFDPFTRLPQDPPGYRWSEMEAKYVPTIDPETGRMAPPVEARVPSTSDLRTSNNTFRHQYRMLSEDEKAQMLELKDRGLEFLALLHRIGHTEREFIAKGEDARLGSRHLALAATAMEEAVMWGVKHVTR